MNLSSLSSQLNISIQDLRVKAREKGFFISPKANKIDNFLAKKLMEVFGKPAEIPKAANQTPKKIKLPSFINVRDFAALLSLPVTSVIKVLIQNGIMATINE